MYNLLIIGSGGFGREVLWLAQAIGKWDKIGFLDDNISARTLINEIEVVGNIDSASDHPNAEICIAIGSPKTKKQIVDKLNSTMQPKFATLIHPQTIISNEVEIGEGSIICAGNILTVNINIGKHVIVNLGCTIGHDVVIHDYATINPQVIISGNVHIAEGSEIGTAAALRQGIKIGADSMVGMGAVVTKDVKENDLVFGNPAKFVKKYQLS